MRTALTAIVFLIMISSAVSAFTIPEGTIIKPNNSATGYYILNKSVSLERLENVGVNLSFINLTANNRTAQIIDNSGNVLETLCANQENCTITQTNTIKQLLFTNPPSNPPNITAHYLSNTQFVQGGTPIIYIKAVSETAISSTWFTLIYPSGIKYNYTASLLNGTSLNGWWAYSISTDVCAADSFTIPYIYAQNIGGLTANATALSFQILCPYQVSSGSSGAGTPATSNISNITQIYGRNISYSFSCEDAFYGGYTKCKTTIVNKGYPTIVFANYTTVVGTQKQTIFKNYLINTSETAVYEEYLPIYSNDDDGYHRIMKMLYSYGLSDFGNAKVTASFEPDTLERIANIKVNSFGAMNWQYLIIAFGVLIMLRMIFKKKKAKKENLREIKEIEEIKT